MAREGFIVPVETQASLKKKTAVSWRWMLLDHTGQGTILDLDKYEIMQRVPIHARDLRILDPLLSYPSIILGRERAIVLNLEHIKAIVTSEEVMQSLCLCVCSIFMFCKLIFFFFFFLVMK
ncbi:hypothetical protein CsSME_00047009 [Camellia sinensis var. sinensis]